MKKFLKCVSVFAALMVIFPLVASADEFDDLLTNGKLVVKSVKPSSKNDAFAVIYENTIMTVDENFMVDWETWINDDLTKVTVGYDKNGNHTVDEGETRVLDVEYVYDADIKAVVDELIAGLGEESDFELTDIEFINYLMNHSDDSSMANYSSKLKKAINYKNFSIDVRMGDGHYFYTAKGGNALFTYDGTVYYIKGMTSAFAKHIIYVDSDAEDPVAAVKARLKAIFGTDFDADGSHTLEEFFEHEENEFKDQYDESEYYQSQYATAGAYATAQMNGLYYNEDAPYHFILGETICDNVLVLTINGDDYTFLIAKDSSKVNNKVELITSDVGTDVTISSNSVAIPFDTLIQVKKLTSGEEYDKIVKILKTTSGEMFDLKLFSSSVGEYITELENGKFEVRIPIKEEFKNKDLKVYYVDADDKVKEYKVTISDDGKYAIFETDHFSIYTLAAEGVANPKTGDSILVFVAMFVISSLFLIRLKRLN